MTMTQERTDLYPNYVESGSHSSSIQIRLDVSLVLRHFEHFLRGEKVEYEEIYDDKGNLQYKPHVIKIGEAKANAKGIQYIMNRVQSLFNAQTVQGNLKDWKDLNEWVADFRENFAYDLMCSLQDYGIDEGEYNQVVDMVVDMVDLFLTRTVANKERESYIPTMRSHEVSHIKEETQSSGLKLPFFKK